MHSQENPLGVVPSPPTAQPVSPGGGGALSTLLSRLSYPSFTPHPFFQRLFQRLFQRRKSLYFQDLRSFLPFFHLFHALLYT